MDCFIFNNESINKIKDAVTIEGPDAVLNSSEENNPIITDSKPPIIAISIKMVGLLLITGMLIIPAAMARNISDNPQKMVLFSIIGGLLSVVIGLFSSLEFNTASGPSIITASLVLFILSLLKIKQSIQLKN